MWNFSWHAGKAARSRDRQQFWQRELEEGVEVFTLPGLIHIESTWNPWNQCWLKPQPSTYHSPMDSIWNSV
jgi:hypothetical protein